MTVEEKIQLGYYTVKAEYPKSESSMLKERIKRNIFTGTLEEIEEQKKIIDCEVALEHKLMVDAYHNEQRRLRMEFCHDLEEELGMSENPKKNLLWEKAWELGHSAGYLEVYNYYYDLVDLIR